MTTILVTGGFGFIGSNFILRHLEKFPDEQVIVLDKITYAANPKNLEDADKTRLIVYRGDIGNEELLANILSAHNPRAIINFAAESHVDRSITGPAPFIKTNILGLATLLDVVRQYAGYRESLKLPFRFVQVGTDEVYGSLAANSPASVELQSPYAPRSPYAASKAAGDFLCKAYYETYGTSIIVTNCCNNYGPRQHVEKFIPTAILSLLNNRKVPVYGDGNNIREWIYVDDHCDALEAVLEKGVSGSQYHIGSSFSTDNRGVAMYIAGAMGRVSSNTADFIEYVKDRPGHDFRYAVNCDKIREELGWEATTDFDAGIRTTIEWYKQNAVFQ